MNDELGDRMKSYENMTRNFIEKGSYGIIRLDGKAFHTYTKDCIRPFDEDLYTHINVAIIELMRHFQGSVFAYTQSDEISILFTDFSSLEAEYWFGGNIQKIASVSASILTAEFNAVRTAYYVDKGLVNPRKRAYFDARVFSLPSQIETMNYFRWRNADCSRNSISMVAQTHYSPSQLHGKKSDEKLEMIQEKLDGGWDGLKESFKYGRIITKELFTNDKDVVRRKWSIKDAWNFFKDTTILDYIPLDSTG